jgi:hypothetical protein
VAEDIRWAVEVGREYGKLLNKVVAEVVADSAAGTARDEEGGSAGEWALLQKPTIVPVGN